MQAQRTVSDLRVVIKDMIQTTKYYPCSRWVVPSGGQGMDKKRAFALWNTMIDPENCTVEDINEIFLNEPNKRSRIDDPNSLQDMMGSFARQS